MELKGEYIVYYKHPKSDRREGIINRFVGTCENFVGSGNCVFRNENKELLVVQFQDIVQMKPDKLKI